MTPPGCLNEHTKVAALPTLAGKTLAEATLTSDKPSTNTDKAGGSNNRHTPGFQIYKHAVTLRISDGKLKKQSKMSSELAKVIQLF